MDLYDGDTKQHRGGVALLTTHRLMYTHPDKAVFWHLGDVQQVDEVPGFMVFSHPKARVALKGGRHVQLSFQSGGSAAFTHMLQTAVQRRSWAAPPPAKRARGATHERTGLAGLRAQAAADRAAASDLSAQAFADVKALMANARLVAGMASSVSAKLARAKGTAAAAAQDGEGMQVAAISRDLGLVNPVTRATAGGGYLPALAREVAAFAAPKVKTAGGILPLTDVYCLYNRARGTELVSPSDFAQACALVNSHGLTPATFGSGVRVLQLTSLSHTASRRRIVRALEDGAAACVQRDGQGLAYVTVLSLASDWGIPLALAKEHLWQAECAGVLCRDVSMQGTRLYLNAFM